MNLEHLIALLGHSSAHPPLDDLLERAGIKKRPQGDDSLIAIVDPTKTVTLDFSAIETYEADVPGGAKSEGAYVLRAVDVDRSFDGPLPFGLDEKNSKQQVDLLLGEPIKVRGNLIASYYKHSHLVVVRFAAGGKALSSLRVAIKDRYHTQNLGI